MPAPYSPPLPSLFDPYFFQGFVQDTPIPKEFIGDRFLPLRTVASDKFSWGMVMNEAPMAEFTVPDAESPRLNDEMLSQGFSEIAYVKIKRVLDAHDMRWMRHYGMAPVSESDPAAPMVTVARQNIARQQDRCLGAVRLRKEWSQLRALYGTIAVTPNARSDVKFTLNFGVSTHTASPLWSDHANSDPFGDMTTWFNPLYYNMRYMITSRANINHMLQSTKVRSMMYLNVTNSAAIPTYVLKSQLAERMQAELGIELIEYNTAYTTDSDAGPGGSVTRSTSPILPATVAVFLPEGEIGFTAQAPAPENEFRVGEWMRLFNPEDSGQIDPLVWQVIAGWYGLPVLTNPTRVHRATISA